MTVLDAVYRREATWICQEPRGELRLAGQTARVLFPGSFNPLHRGHTVLAEQAAARLAAPVAFELSIANVDKLELPAAEAVRRLEQFRDRAPVYVTRAPTFQQKAELFPGCVFVVGADTAQRIVDPRFYDYDLAAMLRALDNIRDAGCQFFVGGRVDSHGRFVELKGVDIPQRHRDLFTGMTEEEFRVDVSSTALRGSRSER